MYNPCDAVTLPSGEKPEIVVFTNDQQRALVQASYRHRYGVFIRVDVCTGLRMGELLALKWEDIDFSTAQLHVRRTINRLAKYEAHDGENKTEIVFGTPKTKNSRRMIPLTRTMADELTRWKQQQAQDKIRPRPNATYIKLIKELSAVGNNLNQIAHFANATGKITEDQWKETHQLLEKIWDFCAYEL